jgi:hypothetical protein
MEPILTLEEAKAVVSTKTAPRVTEESIKAKIRDVDYLSEALTTICMITMQNGFRFIGHSTPADARNYDSQVGQRYAYDNAFKQIWSHEGYLLREKLNNGEL